MIIDIWRSLRALPLWVQVWMVFWLMPINMLGFAFAEPVAIWAASLGTAAMALNAIIVLRQRGLGRVLALPHLPFWTVLVIWLLTVLTGEGAPGGLLGLYLWTLLITDAVSLVFDYRDAWLWWKGDRAVAGRG